MVTDALPEREQSRTGTEYVVCGKNTIHRNEDQAREILEAIEYRADEEDIELSTVSTFRTRLAFNYRTENSSWQHVTIRFREEIISSHSTDSEHSSDAE